MKLRIAAVLGSASLATLHAACFSKPDAPQLTRDGGPKDGATDRVDAANSDPDAKKFLDAAPLCTTVANFDGAPIPGCGPGFGPATVVNATISSNAALHIATSSGGSGRCTTAASYGFAAGFSVDVTQLAASDGAQARFTLSVQNGSKTIEVQVGNSWLITCPDTSTQSMVVNATVPFSIRILPDGQPNEDLSVQVAPQGGSYATIATCTGTLVGLAGSATATLEGSGSASATTISFDNLQACP